MKIMKCSKIVFILSMGVLPVFAGNTDGLTKLKNLKDPASCREAMKQDDPILRRAAFRRLLENSATSREIMLAGMLDSDAWIRQRSLYEYFSKYGESAFPQMEKMATDKDPQVISLLISCAQRLKDKDKSANLLKMIAEKGYTPELRRMASKVCKFTFFRENKRLKDNATHDHDIVKIKSIPLPLKGWRFRIDPMANGHEKKFFEINFKDSAWKTIGIGAWEEQGYPGYDGIAWYRIKFKMPEKITSEAVELAFGAVDETAWVWLNGIYIGQHDIGTHGWDRPFALDVTKEIRWNEENVLTVRVEDTANDGGIWKPVVVDILK